MNDDELRTIEERAAAAIPGPVTVEQGAGELQLHAGPKILFLLWEGREEDAKFYAAARTDVPALCDELRRRRAECYSFTERLGDYETTVTFRTHAELMAHIETVSKNR